MTRKKNFKVLFISIGVLSLIIVITLIYAGFTGQLNITGTAVGRDFNWDIHFENVSTITTTGTAKVLSNHQPVINSNNPTQIKDYEVSLTSPSDSISFTFDVVNDGNYNAKITSVSVDTPLTSSDINTYSSNISVVSYARDGSISYGDATDYANSDIKVIVDAWATDKFRSNQLKEVAGYRAKLITVSEFQQISNSYDWRCGEFYWTMSKSGDRFLSIWPTCGIYSYDDGKGRTVRPVINVYKSATENNNE